MGDYELKQSVEEELDWEPSIDATDIGVAVENGVVTLMGHVSSYLQKSTAERVVSRIKGVRAIAQDLEVRYPGASKNTDDQLAQRAANIIDWNSHMPSGAIQSRVQEGYVTLTGEVDWRYQSNQAYDAVKSLDGVRGVTNKIKLKPKISASNVKDRIEKALVRNAETDSDNISVSVTGSTVTLNGKVDTWHDREIAENAAWAAPGVSSVKDNISIVY